MVVIAPVKRKCPHDVKVMESVMMVMTAPLISVKDEYVSILPIQVVLCAEDECLSVVMDYWKFLKPAMMAIHLPEIAVMIFVR